MIFLICQKCAVDNPALCQVPSAPQCMRLLAKQNFFLDQYYSNKELPKEPLSSCVVASVVMHTHAYITMLQRKLGGERLSYALIEISMNKT